MGVITKPSSVQRSVIVRLLVSCGIALGSGHTRPPAVVSRGSIPQIRPPAQGAARAAADADRAHKTGDGCWCMRATRCLASASATTQHRVQALPGHASPVEGDDRTRSCGRCLLRYALGLYALS